MLQVDSLAKIFLPITKIGAVEQSKTETGGLALANTRKGLKSPTPANPNAISVDQIINHCLVSYGSGTGGLPTTLDAIDDLVLFFKKRFLNALENDPQRWTGKDPKRREEEVFILRCSAAIGRLAAQRAVSQGKIRIDRDDTIAARVAVIGANSPKGVISAFCIEKLIPDESSTPG